MDLRLLASDLPTKGDHRVASAGERAAVGMHTGSGPSLNPKVWTCEDSLALHALGDGGHLACVADAHWGGSSSEAVALNLKPGFFSGPGPVEERLEGALAAASGRIAQASREDASETTALLVHLRGLDLHWLSVGDSLLLHLSRSGIRQLNRPFPAFLGPAGLPLRQGVTMDAGSARLEEGDLLLLATDGLEPQTSGLEPAHVLGFLREPGSLTDRVEQLLLRASSVERGGGRDNLALVAIAAS
jgi:serine/threonine protein phosphatase PrpC